MKVLVIFAIVSVTLISVGLMQSVSSQAMCAGDKTLEDQYQEYDYIFSGKVSEIQPNPVRGKITLTVYEVWKGQPSESITILSGVGESDYSIPFEIGNSYLVFASKLVFDEPVTSGCSPTKPLINASNEIEFLNTKTESQTVNFKYPVPGAGIITHLYSLKTQIESGLSYDQLRCNEGHVLIQKYDGSPACVTPETVPKLVTREWGTSDNWIKISNVNKSIHYETDSVKITSIEAFSDHKNTSLPEETKQTWLRIAIESDQGGNIKITLPRNLIDSKAGSTDDDFFVLLDGTETEYSETKKESERMLNFTIPPKTKLVEIIGYGFYNPDFNELNYESLTELDKKCSIEKPGSIWYDTEKLCTYTTHVTTMGGHTIPSCNNGTIISSDNNAKTVPVLMMQPNSTGIICITYNFPYDWETFPIKDSYPDHKFHFDLINIVSEHFTVTANPEWIDTQTISAGDNVTVIYKIHADSNSQGLYDTVIPYGNCQRYPFAVGYDESEIIPSDFPNASMTPPCVFVFSGEKQVTIVSGMEYFELDYK